MSTLAISIENKLTLSNLGKVAFILYIFFIIFGVTLPFQEDYASVDDIVASNPFKQLIFVFIYLLSFIAISNKFFSLYSIIKREKFLFVFIIWALLSVIWSDFSVISFKRWIQLIGAYLVISVGLLSFKNIDDFIAVIKKILMIYIFITIVSIVLVPEAKIYDGAWRGISTHKNQLGQIMLISLIIWFDSFKNKIGNNKVNLFFLLTSLVILIGSRSTTSVLTALVIFLFGIVLYIKNYFNEYKPPLGNILLFIFILFLSIIIISLPYYLIHPIDEFFKLLGKDLTFTGRTELWSAILREFLNHWLIGAGFQGYWVVDNPELIGIYREFIWLPIQAHSGYIDLLNEVGVIGFCIFLFMIIQYFTTRSKLVLKDNWSLIIIAILIFNFQESSIFRANVFSGIFLILSYLKLFYIKSELERISDEKATDTAFVI